MTNRPRLLLAASALAVFGCSALATLDVGEGPAGSTPPLFERLRQEALEGDVEAQNVLGFMLFFGEHAPLNRAAAEDWFARAANGGSLEAAANLAIMYYLGFGVQRDVNRAQGYLEQARAEEA